MKKTYRKLLYRELWKSMSRFLAVFAIVALGVGFLAGLLATTPDMRLSADAYYDKLKMMDLRIASTLGLTENDMQAIRQTKGVAAVMPSYTTDAVLSTQENQSLVARLHSLPPKRDAADGSYQNQPELREGRLPEKPGECLAINNQMMSKGIVLGDTLVLSAENEDMSDTLASTSYTVVGLADSAYYMAREKEHSKLGNGTLQCILYVSEDSFSLPVYTDAYVLVENAAEETAFTDAYADTVKAVQETLETLGKAQATVRYEELIGEATDKLHEGKADYEKAKTDVDKELSDALQKLTDGKKELANGEKALADQRKKAQSETAAAQKKLEDGAVQLAGGQKALADAKATLDKTALELQQAESTMQALLAAGNKPAADAIAAQLAQAKPRYEAGVADYQKQVAVLHATEQALAQGQKDLESGKSKAETAFAKAEKELAKARTTLTQGQKDYEKGKKEADEKLAEARAEIEDGEQKIRDIAQPEWFVLDRHSNVSYTSFEGNVEKIAAIATVFPIFFFLVAALVALTTMTRMVEEQRTQIGTLRALGYGKFSIASYYLIYAGIATILGCIAGLLVGFHVLPSVVWGAYSIMYVLPPLIPQFHVPIAAVGAGVALLCTMAATLFACMGTLHECAASLMLPRAPKAGKRVLLERITPLWSRLKFTHKVTVRNLFRYKKRFFMTIIGIAGCTALLLTGFGLRDSIGGIVEKQFGELYQYNLIVSVKEDTVLQKEEAFQAFLQNTDTVSEYLPVSQENGTAKHQAKGKETDIVLCIPQDDQKLPDFICLRERKTGKPVPFEESGVLVTEKQAELLGLRAGDTVSIENADGKHADFKVNGIVENYVQGFVYMPLSLYTKAYGAPPTFPLLNVKTADMSAEERDVFAKDLLKFDLVAGAQFTEDIEVSFSDVIKNIDYIVMVLIICAGLLAFVVMYNLININITERQKEIATIKVLGFYNHEVAAYIYRETFLLSLIGTAVGLVLGIFLHSFVVRTAEVDIVMFGREIKWISYVLSALLTLLFSAIVNLVMLKKLRDVDMVESMKAGE